MRSTWQRSRIAVAEALSQLSKHWLPQSIQWLVSPATFPIGTTMKPFLTSLLCQHLVFKCKQCFGNKLILLWFFLRTSTFKQVWLDTNLNPNLNAGTDTNQCHSTRNKTVIQRSRIYQIKFLLPSKWKQHLKILIEESQTPKVHKHSDSVPNVRNCPVECYLWSGSYK